MHCPPSKRRDFCLITGQSLAGAEVIVDQGSLPIPGLFMPSPESAAGVSSRVRLVRAPGSGLLQLDHDLNPDLYFYYKSGRVDSSHIKHIESTADAIALRYSTCARILEIGGGAGHLMKALARRGFTNLHVVDPSAENEEGQGYQAIRGIFPEALVDCKIQFDLIIGQHFLEHSAVPVAVLQAAAGLMTKSGEVWIEVPDIERSALADHGESLSIIYALHSGYYDATTLGIIGTEAGLNLLRIYPVDHYGKSLVAVFGRSGPSIATTGQDHPQISAASQQVTAAIRGYFHQLADFGQALPPGLLCWGAAERCITVLGACMAGGFRPGAICDSNPDLRGLFP